MTTTTPQPQIIHNANAVVLTPDLVAALRRARPVIEFRRNRPMATFHLCLPTSREAVAKWDTKPVCGIKVNGPAEEPRSRAKFGTDVVHPLLCLHCWQRREGAGHD